MKIYIWIFVISLSVNLQMILAKLYDLPELLESNTYDDGKVTRLAYLGKLIHMLQDCVQEIGLYGMCFVTFLFNTSDEI